MVTMSKAKRMGKTHSVSKGGHKAAKKAREAKLLAKFAKRREAGKTYEYKSVEEVLGSNAPKREIIQEKNKRAKKNANSGNKTEYDKWKSVQRKQDNRLAEVAEAEKEGRAQKKS